MNINLTLIGQSITFALFVWFCYAFIWPPLVNALANRKKQIADGLAAAERGQHEQELAALILFVEGRTAEALALISEATKAEEARPLEYGPPSVVKPSHELMGEMLLALDRPADATAQFTKALERAPRRTLSVLGLATAAEQFGDMQTATEARQTLDEIWKNDDVEVTAGVPLAPVLN